MAPLNWPTIEAVNAKSLSEEQADELFGTLKDGKVGDDFDTVKLKKLFEVCQAVMVNRNQLLEDAMTEAELEAKKAMKKEQELKKEIERAKKELEEIKKHGPSEGGSKDTRYLRGQLQDLEEMNDKLKLEIKDLNRDLNSEKRAAEKYSERINELEKELKETREDNDQMRQDISDYKMQMQSQRDNIVSRRGEDAEFKEKLAKKNRELAETMEELQNMTDANDLLQKRCEDLQRNLEEAITQMDRTSEDYLKLKNVLQQSDAVTDALREENELLKNQVQDLSEQVRSKGEADDAIMVAVNQKVDEWQEIMQEKDIQMVNLQDEIFKLKSQLIAANMDSDKASVSALSEVLKDKDKQIAELTEKVDQYTIEMEKNAALIEDLNNELHKAGSSQGDRMQTKVREFQNENKLLRERLQQAEAENKKADQDCRVKDKELSELLERMRQYEAGEYGLAEAVNEIKEGKNQVKIREREIEELTQYINKAELKINELLDENEELRYKLGMDPKAPMDLTEFRKNKAIRQEEMKALNFTLQREIEMLEEERVADKKKIRKLAQQLGQRAVALGLTAEDMLAVQDYTETLKAKRQVQDEQQSAAVIIRQQVQKEESMIRGKEWDKDYKENVAELHKLEVQVAELRAQNQQLNKDNENLEAGFKEVMQALQKGATESQGDVDSSAPVMQFPAIERMLAAIEAKKVLGNYDTTYFLKEQMDILKGRNEELRNTLREIRVEVTKTSLERDKAFEKIEKLEKDHFMFSEAGAGPGMFQFMKLPEGMAPSSSEVIAHLNEHLIITLQELSQREGVMKKTEAAFENYKRKYAVLRHQQGMLYQEYLKEKSVWQEDMEKYSKQLKELQGQREEDLVRIQEFDRLVDTLSTDDVEVRRRLSEMTRRITVLRVNEKALTRRHAIMEEIETQLRREVERQRNEMGQMEAAVSERIGYLQRYKDMAAFKIAALQKALEDSVPSADLEKVNKQYHNLTEKYRDMLEKGNTLVSKAEALEGLEGEIKQLTADNEVLKKTLEMEKEKLHALEAAMEELHRRGVASGSEVSVTDGDIISISKKITMLEMKELNERQRAEHASHMYQQQHQILHEMESRNKELEEKFAEVTKMNLEMQKIERDMRDELSNSVTKSISDADRKRISVLEETELTLKQEISKLKEMAEIASTQVRTLETQHIAREKEYQSLRQQLLDFQVQSDEKTIIGKLHRHIVQLQVSEGSAIKRLEEAQKKVTKLEAQMLRQEQRVDEKDQTIYHTRQEAQGKARYLRKSLQELRIQFAGAVPLSKQEKFSRSMMQLQQDKAKLEKDLKETREHKNEMEDKLAALSLQQNSLQELIAVLKDGRGAQKVAEWHSKIDGIRLDELKQRRMCAKLQQKVRYLEEIITSHEVTISELEADNVRMMKDYEEKQMRWELRETELERTIITMEKHTAEIAGAASKFELAVGSLPSAKLPVANQLEQAISTIKGNVKVILDTQAENKSLKARNQELEKLLRDSERGILERDKLISELRLRMPATADRDDIIIQAQAKVTQAIKKAETGGIDYESQQALKIAQSTVHSLQQRINQKDETIAKYMILLKQGREDMVQMNQRHEEELRAMQHKIHMNTDLAFSKFKEAARELINKQSSSKTVTAQQLSRLNELEDTVAEQENTISALHEKIKQKEEEILKLHASLSIFNRNLKSEQTRLAEQHGEIVGKKESEIEMVSRENEDLRKEVKLLQDEVAALKDVNQRGPTATMKNMVERLKNQLALKEKQHQALSKALTDLRADMVSQAQVLANDASQEKNIQKIINEHTKQISDQLEDQQTLADRLKKELKKKKDEEGALQTELEDVKEELNKKERTIEKLKASKARLESEVDELEKKMEKITAARSLKAGEFEKQQELDDMRRKCRALEDQLSRQLAAEKPYEQKEEKTKQEDTIRWEESKKWQRTIEKMKVKIKERDKEIETLNGTVNRLKALLERTNREKDIQAPLIQKTSAVSLSAAPGGKLDHEREDLKATIYKLQDEIRTLKHQALMSQDAALEEVQMRNQHLREQLEQMERAMAARPSDSGVSAAEYQKLFLKNQELQRDVLRLNEENIELRFEVESSRKDIPRLKERVQDLQSYVEALKFENGQLTGDSARSSLSSIKRIGESGKSQRELEKTIALLKKVVERVQAENTALKKAPGVVSQEQLNLLKRENDGLKSQLEELRQTMGLELSERYTAQQKGTAKMVNDFDKLRKELAKEKDDNEKLRMKIRSLEVQAEHQDKELRSTKTKLEVEAVKKPSMATLDSQGWKSAVQTRMYEEKIKGMEADLEKKSKQLQDNKVLLRDAAEREQALLREKDDFLQKIAILERFPSGSGAVDSNLMKDYQQSRVRVDRLENEKKELLNELRLARQNQSGSDTSQINDDVLTKASNYDKIMRENIEIHMQLKSVELDKEKLRREVDKLKKELNNFGPEFFEEIEDLKYNYKQSLQHNVLLEDKLKQVAQQFGLSIEIPKKISTK
ncbi:centrosomal protein of 290 kDa-like [Biomphalaria glabrata]|uniref:Centrosomal protein of 290 kDa-like n=1 Tax=Biomphalaria glabrata TaxID=6526 RepID=A0A9W3ALA8_BIOGL|nr:centrosomal protein of 290 kDa-like [Biomphalaria glabrata]XP_055888046.1 centrosomal protein of 290 kDa-like [Biomphalaria glabrata]